MGCQPAVHLATTVGKELDLKMQKDKYLSDSTAALWWIQEEPWN